MFVVSGLSKIAGTAADEGGLDCGDGAGAGAAMDRLEVIADTFLSMNAPVQCALPAWLAGRHEIQGQIRERVAANLAELDRQLGRGGCCTAAGGGGRLVRGASHSGAAAGRADGAGAAGAGVWVHPGYFFGMEESAGWW